MLIEILLAVIGLSLITISLTASRLGGSPGFGPLKILLASVGLVVLAFAFLLCKREALPPYIRRAISSAAGKLLLIVGSILVALTFIEISLNLVEMVKGCSIASDMEGLLQPITDSRLGLRLPPYSKGHDANGFRNANVPDKVDIVAIGDSQTWGINASMPEAYPQTLASLSKKRVYNMGLGSYGPVQYRVLTEEALELQPKVIIVGLYFGNDLYDAYHMVYGFETYKSSRQKKPDLALTNDTIGSGYQALRDEIGKFEQKSSESLPAEGWINILCRASKLICFLKKHGLSPGNLHDRAYEAEKAWALAFPDHGLAYERGNARTILTPAYRLTVLDLDDPRTAEGLRITKMMLLLIKEKTDSANVSLIVLLIPTKEMAYSDSVRQEQGRVLPVYGKLIRMEAKAKGDIKLFCERNGVYTVDALPTFQEAIKNNKQIYPNLSDGHPNCMGYILLAEVLNKSLDKMSLNYDAASYHVP